MNEQTERELVEIIESREFKVIKKRYWNFFSLVPYFLLYKILGRQTNLTGTRGDSFISRLLDIWFRHIENKINFGVGLSIIIVAEKI